MQKKEKHAKILFIFVKLQDQRISMDISEQIFQSFTKNLRIILVQKFGYFSH